MFRTSMCPSSGENCCIHATLALSLCTGGVWSAGWNESNQQTSWLEWTQPTDQTPPIQSDKYQCRKDTAIFSWWWEHGCPKHVEKRNKYTRLAEHSSATRQLQFLPTSINKPSRVLPHSERKQCGMQNRFEISTYRVFGGRICYHR